MSKEKIATLVIFPLILLAVCYLGYRITDTFFFSYAKGSLTFRAEGKPEKSIGLTSCRLFMDNGNTPQLLISDGQQDGMKIYLEGGTPIRFIPILQGKETPNQKSSCDITNSTLELVSFNTGGKFFSSKVGQSWKGSIEATCDIPNGKLEIKAEVHACQ